MKKILLAMLIMLPMFLSAQTAKVIELKSSDAAEIKSLYEQRALIDEKIKQFEDRVIENYIRVPALIDKHGDFYCATETLNNGLLSYAPMDHKCYRPGWWNGKFTFSEDFKFIVPKPETVINTITTWPCGSSITPASVQ